MAEMLSYFNHLVRLILKSRQDIAGEALDQEENLCYLFPLHVNILLL